MAIPGLSSITGGGVSLGSLYVNLTADSTTLVRGFDSAVLSVTRGASAIETALANPIAALAALGAAAVGAGIAIAALSADQLIKFDSAMTRSTSIMGDMGVKMRKELEDTARQISLTSTTSSVDLAKSYLNLASAGLDAAQSQKALAQVNNFSIAGFVDQSRAANLLIDSMTTLGLRMKDPVQNMENMQRLSDLLVKANILATGTTEQFAQAVQNRAGAAMREFRIPVEQGIAVLAAYTDKGIKGVEAGEQFAIMLRDLQRAALHNTEEFERMNITVFDSEGNIRHLASVIGDMQKALGGMSAEQKRAELTALGFQDRSLNAVLAVMSSSQSIRDYEKALKEAGGTTQEVADKNLTSLESQFEITKNVVKDLWLTIGKDALNGALVEMNGILRASATAAKDLYEPFSKLLSVVKPLVSAMVDLSMRMASMQASLFAKSPMGMILNKMTGGGADDLAVASKKVVTTFENMDKGVTKALDSTAKKTIDTFHVVKDEMNAAVNQAEANSIRMNKLLDRLGAPGLKDFTGIMRRDANGKVIGMSQNELAFQTQKGLGSFGDQGVNQALSLNREMEQNNTRLADIKKLSDKEVTLNEETQKRKLQAIQLYNDKAKQFQLAQTAFVLSTMHQMSDNLLTMAEQMGGKQTVIYKAMFAASKAFAIAEAVVKIQQAIAAAAGGLPWPANLAAMANVIAATASIVSTITSTKLEFAGGKATGGPVGSGKMYMVGERGPEMFVPGGAGSIIPNDRLGGGRTSVIVNNYTDAQPVVNERNEGDQRVVEVILRRVNNQIATDIRDGRGNITKSLEKTFSLRRGQTQ